MYQPFQDTKRNLWFKKFDPKVWQPMASQASKKTLESLGGLDGNLKRGQSSGFADRLLENETPFWPMIFQSVWPQF